MREWLGRLRGPGSAAQIVGSMLLLVVGVDGAQEAQSENPQGKDSGETPSHASFSLVFEVGRTHCLAVEKQCSLTCLCCCADRVGSSSVLSSAVMCVCFLNSIVHLDPPRESNIATQDFVSHSVRQSIVFVHG